MEVIKKNKTIFTIGLIIMVIIVSFYIVNQNKKKSSLVEISKSIYEENGRVIEFLELPENEAETIVCNFYLLEITGKYNSLGKLFPSVENTKNSSLINYENGQGYKYIKILEINSLEKDELEKEKLYDDLFKDIKFFSDKTYNEETYNEVVEEKNLNEYKLVSVKLETQYTDVSLKMSPQYPDGLSERYFIVAPNKKGSYIIVCDNVR